MTKEDIIKAIWIELPNLTQQKAKKAYETTMDLIKDRLSKDECIGLRGFGLFKILEKKERMGRNPKNGMKAVIKPRRVVTFHPSKMFKNQVDKNNDSQ